MSTTSSPKSFPALQKRLTVFLFATVAALLFLPQTQNALPHSARSIQAATLLLRPAMLLPSAHDFWHTEGNRILDTHNRPIRISGMNWSGFETRQTVPGGLDAQDYRAILRTIKQSGYNTVRIPFSNEMVETPSVPDHVSFSNGSGSINTDLRDLTSLEILDKIVAYSGKIGLKIILDNHRSEAGSSAQESGLWYTTQFPESAWIEDWTSLTRRYQNNSTVIGMDLRNEPHNAEKGGSCWDCGGTNDWHRAAQRVGNAILAVNPHLLIFVEGVDSYADDTYWWGGNLEGVRRSPVHLSIPNHLVYSAHEYGPDEYAQSWFNASTSPATLASVWRRHWAYISEAGIAPVWIGEFGTPNNDADVQSSTPGSEGQWFASLIGFLGSHPALGWTYWGVNGEDRYGLLSAGYSNEPANQLKAEALTSIANGPFLQQAKQIDTSAPSLPSSYPSLPINYSQPAVSKGGEVRTQTSIPTQPNELVYPIPTERTHGFPLRNAKGSSRLQSQTSVRSPGASVQDAISASIYNAVSTANQGLAAEVHTSSR